MLVIIKQGYEQEISRVRRKPKENLPNLIQKEYISGVGGSPTKKKSKSVKRQKNKMQ